jgi:hypothetical protein
MNLSYTTSTREEGGGRRQNKYQHNVIYRCIVAITVHYTVEKKNEHPYEDEEKKPNRNQQIRISFTYIL